MSAWNFRYFSLAFILSNIIIIRQAKSVDNLKGIVIQNGQPSINQRLCVCVSECPRANDVAKARIAFFCSFRFDRFRFSLERFFLRFLFNSRILLFFVVFVRCCLPFRLSFRSHLFDAFRCQCRVSANDSIWGWQKKNKFTRARKNK